MFGIAVPEAQRRLAKTAPIGAKSKGSSPLSRRCKSFPRFWRASLEKPRMTSCESPSQRIRVCEPGLVTVNSI